MENRVDWGLPSSESLLWPGCVVHVKNRTIPKVYNNLKFYFTVPKYLDCLPLEAFKIIRLQVKLSNCSVHFRYRSLIFFLASTLQFTKSLL
jgi:hypothetical protein